MISHHCLHHHCHNHHHHNHHIIILIIIIICSNVKWLEAGGVQVVPIIVNGSIDQTDYFREVDIIIILMIVIMINFTITLFNLIQMFTSLNGLMIPGGPDSSIHPDAGINCSVMFTLDIFSKTHLRSRK